MHQLWALVHAASACEKSRFSVATRGSSAEGSEIAISFIYVIKVCQSCHQYVLEPAKLCVDIWLNIYASRGGEYCLFTAVDTFGAEEAYHVREIDPAFSNLENRGTEAYNENLEIFAASKFSGSAENQLEFS